MSRYECRGEILARLIGLNFLIKLKQLLSTFDGRGFVGADALNQREYRSGFIDWQSRLNGLSFDFLQRCGHVTVSCFGVVQ